MDHRHPEKQGIAISGIGPEISTVRSDVTAMNHWTVSNTAANQISELVISLGTKDDGVKTIKIVKKVLKGLSCLCREINTVHHWIDGNTIRSDPKGRQMNLDEKIGPALD